MFPLAIPADKTTIPSIIIKHLDTGKLGITLFTINAIRSVPPVEPSTLNTIPKPVPSNIAPDIADNNISCVADIVANGSVIFNILDNIIIPINVFIASFLPNIFIEDAKSGTPIRSIIVETDSPVNLLITRDKPLSPPGAIVYGLKNILSPTPINIQPIISPKNSIIIFVDFFILYNHPNPKLLYQFFIFLAMYLIIYLRIK